MRDIMYALSSSVFAAIFLVAVIVYGGEIARNAAILAAFVACISQFTAQDPTSYRLSIYSAYVAFVAGLFAYLSMALGH